MKNFSFYAPTYFAFGKDTENEAGAYVKRFGGTKVLVHYGGGSVIRSGLLYRVTTSLENEGIPYVLLGGVLPNPRSGLVYEGIKLCREEGVDFVLAVGGGSAIDSAKAIAAGAVYEGDFWDYYTGKRIEKALPMGTILTISAAGSEGSPDSVITNENGMFKRGASGDAIRPKFSILNPALTQTLPAYQTAAGITDIMAHLLERYFTNTKDVEVTDRVIEGLLMTMIHEAPKVIANPDDYEARANIMWAGMMAHNDCCGVGRDQDWASHNIEHELSALYDCAHGAGLAAVFPERQETIKAAGLRDETFAGTIRVCSVPPALLTLSGEIKGWVESNSAALSSPMQSESFNGYSYTLKTGGGTAGGSGPLTWRDIYGKQLERWRRPFV